MYKLTLKYQRVDDSRRRMKEMLDASYGVYIKMEPKQKDSWREQTMGQLQAHLEHELAEIKRSDTLEKKLHNALDACGVSALLAARLQLMVEKIE
jgi:hypothetical protein